LSYAPKFILRIPLPDSQPHFFFVWHSLVGLLHRMHILLDDDKFYHMILYLDTAFDILSCVL
jgi:hypothetical protein